MQLSCQLFKCLEMLLVICLAYRITILVLSIQIHHYFRKCLVKHYQTIKKCHFYSVFHNATVTANLFQILEMLLAMYLTYRIKCFLPLFGMANPDPSSIFSGRLSNKLKAVVFIVFTTNLFEFLEMLAEICYT